MFCKNTQQTIDALLGLQDNETLCVNAIRQLMDQQNNNQNKIASVQSDTGEVTLAEFVKLLRSVIPSS